MDSHRGQDLGQWRINSRRRYYMFCSEILPDPGSKGRRSCPRLLIQDKPFPYPEDNGDQGREESLPTSEARAFFRVFKRQRLAASQSASGGEEYVGTCLFPTIPVTSSPITKVSLGQCTRTGGKAAEVQGILRGPRELPWRLPLGPVASPLLVGICLAAPSPGPL